ncbi:MAG TPA: hypothetical protein VG722_05450, partial [Tepidisphaeraceae bacterium]|nr:hypothetical protein [Tepidisphaeraceae bacterium]
LAIAGTDIARHARSLMFMRYTFAAGPAVCFLLATFLEMRRIFWVVPAAVFVVCIRTVSFAYSNVMVWRNVADLLHSGVRQGDTIIYTPGPYETSWAQTTFLGISHYAPVLPAAIVILTDSHSAALQQVLNPGHSTWVLCNDPDIAPNSLDPNAQVIQTGIAPSIGRVSELAPR